MKPAARQITDPAPRVIQLGPRAPQPAPRPKTRHGSENRRRTAAITMRTLPEHKERLQQEAAAAGMSVQAYLLAARLGEDAAPPRRPPPRAVSIETDALTAAVVAFSRANNNLNQTAHAVNTMMLFAEEHGYERLVEVAQNILRSVDRLRDDFTPPLAAIMAALSYDR